MHNNFDLIRKNIEKQIVISDDEFKFFSDFLTEKNSKKGILIERR